MQPAAQVATQSTPQPVPGVVGTPDPEAFRNLVTVYFRWLHKQQTPQLAEERQAVAEDATA